MTYVCLPVEETFFRMLRHREFEAAEMPLRSYVTNLAADPDGSAFVAISGAVAVLGVQAGQGPDGEVERTRGYSASTSGPTGSSATAPPSRRSYITPTSRA